ncbi:MAG: helix-turn-helix transcriptional regulator [Candidatus Kapabacteria bacterium]|nr:helix-turn-helix transcriptional regulator [Candidatus Kapabacteria bacterium]
MKTKIEIFVIDKAKEKRTEKKYSQVELAELLGVSSGFIGKVESPKYPTKYNLNHINKLAIIFNCSPKEFLPSTIGDPNEN